MKVTRRQFLKMSGALGGYLLTGPALWVGGGLPEAYADVGPKTGTETTTICCFCGVGCGAVVTTDVATNKIVAVEGDPVSPINEGTLCSKGQAQFQTANQLVLDTDLATKPGFQINAKRAKWPNGKRLARVLYRAPGANKWQILSWSTALGMMAQRIYNTRKDGFDMGPEEFPLMRCNNIAALGGAAHDSQECYLMRKFWTGLGLVNIDHQARI